MSIFKFVVVFSLSILNAHSSLAGDIRNRHDFSARDLLISNFAAADNLLSVSRKKLVEDLPILITTIVNMDDLEQSSSLGRIVSEHLATRMSNKNFEVLEARMQNYVYMKNDVGEFVLTRKFAGISSDSKVQAILVGTYFTGKQEVAINIKLVQPVTNSVLGATDYIIPISEFTANLLGLKREIIEKKSSVIRVTGDTCGGLQCGTR